MFLSISCVRRRRLRRFFREDVPGVARILDLRLEDLAFGVKLRRVRYEFEADGRMRRGSDTVLPVIADRWREGEEIEILYIPARGYDSVIVSAEGRLTGMYDSTAAVCSHPQCGRDSARTVKVVVVAVVPPPTRSRT